MLLIWIFLDDVGKSLVVLGHFAIFVRAAGIAGAILSSKEPAIGDAAVVEPPLAIHDTQSQDP
jgi:hypothetical protein